MSTSPLRFTFCPSRILPPMLQDPSDNFVRLRDFVDAKNCLKLAAFSKDQVGLSSYLTFCVACFLKVVQGFTEKMAEAAAKELKICKKQVNYPPAGFRGEYFSKNEYICTYPKNGPARESSPPWYLDSNISVRTPKKAIFLHVIVVIFQHETPKSVFLCTIE